MDWFRSWHGAPTDPKWLVIDRRAHCEGITPGMVSAVAWALMDYASQNSDRGSVDGFDVETYSAWSGWSEDQIEAILEAMRGKGIITEDNRLAAWDKRQPKKEDPNSTNRVRRWRDSQRNEALQERNSSVTNEDVTPRNAVKRNETPRNAPEKIREDKKREEKNTATAVHFAAAVAAWEAGGLTVNPIMADEIEATVQEWEKFGHPEYVKDAIEVAIKANVRRWDYVQGILRRCADNGTAPNHKPGKKEATNGKSSLGFSSVAADAPRKPTAAEIAEWERWEDELAAKQAASA